MARFIQSAFSKGEIAPALYARVTTVAYRNALRTARNVVVHVSGGVGSRPGSKFRAPVGDHTTSPYLIPFEFKTTDKYQLEFGNLYMRVMRNGEEVRGLSIFEHF